jgi:hypothetical protein
VAVAATLKFAPVCPLKAPAALFSWRPGLALVLAASLLLLAQAILEEVELLLLLPANLVLLMALGVLLLHPVDLVNLVAVWF